MNGRLVLWLLVSTAVMAPGLPVAFAEKPPEDAGFGFVLRSTDFGDPCTPDPGDIPRIFDNHGVNSVDVSFKIVNTGDSILFVAGTGFVIPPSGPSRRPRVIRLTVDPGDSIGIQAQTSKCAWLAIIRPH